LENLRDSKHTNRAWETIKENIKISAKESLGLYILKQHKPSFDYAFLHFVDKRSMLKCMFTGPKQNNIDNLTM
jgi:hypothetical protein